MFKQTQKRLSKLMLVQNQAQTEDKLNTIIKTFRQNHEKLIQKIQECDKKREIEHQAAKKKNKEKHLLEKIQQKMYKISDGPHFFSRPFSQLKTDRMKNRFDESLRKQNLGYQSVKRHPIFKDQDCQELQMSPFDQQNIKLVKVNINKLVPLSIDKLRQKIKML